MVEGELVNVRQSAVEELCEDMETQALTVRELVLRQPPVQLLGYLMCQFHMAMMLAPDGSEGDPRPNKDVITKFQFALEYVHAVWSGSASLAEASTDLDEGLAGELMTVLDELQAKTMFYCMASSATKTEFHAKSAWALLRGHRYQVLEAEFFRFVLAPHEEALREAYEADVQDIASGIQNIADALRTGFSDAADKLVEHMERVDAIVAESGDTLQAVLARLQSSDGGFGTQMTDVFHDLLFGGVCNLSRHSGLPQPLLEDLSYEPGQNEEFFAKGAFSGTPLRTLPARIKPGILLGKEYYATDGQFVRDSAYRAIQWGLWKRLSYRDEWLKRQGRMAEQAFPAIFAHQLRQAQIFENVFFRDPQSGDWVETDLLILLNDVIFVIEAKAGAMPMQSPATNFASHERVIKSLITDAFRQCQRFIEYLASGSEVPLHELVDGEYREVVRIRQDQFRLIIPIGLTVEAFTPFSAMAKELPEVEPILGKHPFISMSIDDLFVLRRFLPTTGELVHYLEVRQQVAGIEGALLFDETDHLGAYIAKNRFDMDIREQLTEADQVTWDGFGDKVDRHFEGEDWEEKPIPSQDFPEGLEALLKALDDLRPRSWLRFDGLLRDFGQDGRDNVSRYLEQLIPTLVDHPRRRFLIGDSPPLQFWLFREGFAPDPDSVRFEAQVGCLILGAQETSVLLVTFDANLAIVGLACEFHKAPSVLQSDYSGLIEEAKRQRKRLVSLG